MRLLILLLLFPSLAFAELTPLQQKKIEQQVKHYLSHRGGLIWIYDLKMKQGYQWGKKDWWEQPVSLGSIIKIPLVMYMIDHQLTDFEYACRGNDVWHHRIYYCWLDKGHGKLNLREALANSCNLYFATLLKKIPRKNLFNYFQTVGFPVDAKNAPPEFPDLFFQKQVGMYLKLNLLKTWMIDLAMKLQEPHYLLLKNAMQQSVNTGTAQQARQQSIQVLAKTGTGKSADLEMNHTYDFNGFFLGYAPAERPTYLVFVFIQDSVGANIPSKLAREIISVLL